MEPYKLGEMEEKFAQLIWEKKKLIDPTRRIK